VGRYNEGGQNHSQALGMVRPPLKPKLFFKVFFFFFFFNLLRVPRPPPLAKGVAGAWSLEPPFDFYFFLIVLIFLIYLFF
jgi:hypothetical protein